MHIPDGFLDAKTWGTLGMVSAAAVGAAAMYARRHLKEQDIPLMGVLAAFIFASQMLNFPVASGTSGHFLGGALAAILLGPARGLLVMTAILVVQAFLFGDGGVTALGANVFNMGVIGAVGAYLIYRAVRRALGGTAIGAPAFIAAWASVVLAAVACSLELAASGTAPLVVVLPAMVGIHAIIGVGEGLVTAGAMALVHRARPELLEAHTG